MVLILLEGYEGTLFLVTNRIKNIDDAFHSRIHVTINYPDLSTDSRRHIWPTFLGTASAATGQDLGEVGQSGAEWTSDQESSENDTKVGSEPDEKQAGDLPGPKVEFRHVDTVLAIKRSAS